MGSRSSGSSSSASASNTYKSELSQEQLGILQSRENQYQKYFFPALQAGIAENTAGSQAFNTRLGKTANEINTAFDANQAKIRQQLAQQNMLGSSSGVQAALQQANERSRASALASAYADQLAAADASKTNYLQVAAAMSPQPTNSAEYYSTSSASGAEKRQGWNVNGSVTDLFAGSGGNKNTPHK